MVEAAVAADPEIAMLYLNRKVGEAVIINHDIEVRVVAVSGKTVKRRRRHGGRAEQGGLRTARRMTPWDHRRASA